MSLIICQNGREICSTCELFTSPQVSYVQIYDFVKNAPIYEVGEYLRKENPTFYDAFVDMLIFDSLICNQDRHYGNFGLLVENETNTPIAFAPVFDNGLSLFHAGMPEHFENINTYAKTRMSYYNIPLLDLAREFITQRQKQKLRKMIYFKFDKHPSYNLSSRRLKAIEQFIQNRVHELLALENK